MGNKPYSYNEYNAYWNKKHSISIRRFNVCKYQWYVIMKHYFFFFLDSSLPFFFPWLLTKSEFTTEFIGSPCHRDHSVYLSRHAVTSCLHHTCQHGRKRALNSLPLLHFNNHCMQLFAWIMWLTFFFFDSPTALLFIF